MRRPRLLTVAFVTITLSVPLRPAVSAGGVSERYENQRRNADLYLLHLSDPYLRSTQLTGYKGEDDFDGSPSWFRFDDGNYVAYNAYPADPPPKQLESDIYVRNLTTGEEFNMTDDPDCNQFPAWSPDGRYLAFHGSRGPNEAYHGIHIWNWRTREEFAHLTYGHDTLPAWSRAGDRLAFTRTGSRWEILARNLDGSGEQHIVTGGTYASWGPGDTRIVFSGDDNEIYVTDLANGSIHLLTTQRFGREIDPEWSPDGTRIAFTSYRDGNPEIYVMWANGTDQTRVTFNEGFDGYPSWTPDGNIVYSSEREVRPQRDGSRGREVRTFAGTCRE
jgi:TolB protein